jgi:AraC-like DNA-binding protein
MKALLKLINAQQDRIFQIMKVNEPYFYPHWHFHPECEIMLVLEGAGMRFAGDSMERFRPGDLVLFGDKIPHLFRSDKVYYEKDSGVISKAFVVYFDEALLKGEFWNGISFSSLRKLFALSKRGIKFTGKSRSKIKSKLLELDDSKDSLEKMIDLLTVLKLMSESAEYELLSSDGFTNFIAEDDCERINKVYQFVMDNYTKNPSLEEVAEIACMSPTAFCRFFKSHTNKTYIQFLNEVKIGNACNLLINNDLSISEICYMTGFNNTAHFNNQFRKILGVTPSEYKHEHIEFVPS